MSIINDHTGRFLLQSDCMFLGAGNTECYGLHMQYRYNIISFTVLPTTQFLAIKGYDYCQK
jgi:hypothetical protein